MLFDLQSPGRKRVVRVVFGTLAAIFAISFVFLGIGSGINADFTGPLGDLLGTNDPPDSGFDDEIEELEKRLEANPNDTAALAELITVRYQAGTQLVEQDPETGGINVTSEAEDELQQAGEAWNRYLKASKGMVDSSTAILAYQTFATLADDSLGEARGASSTTEVLDKADGAVVNWSAAAEAQRLAADQQPTASAYVRVASLLYLAGETKGAEEAAAKARSTAKPNEAKQIDAQLKQAEQQGTQINEAIAKVRKQDQKQQEQFGGGQGNPLEDVGGGALGGGTTGLTPYPRTRGSFLYFPPGARERPRAVSSAGRAGDS
jgi:tetratricopeptide (TPR) repeat protein